jgi:hypothetical protein
MSNENASAERTRIRDLEASEQDTFEFWLERCPDEMRLSAYRRGRHGVHVYAVDRGSEGAHLYGIRRDGDD